PVGGRRPAARGAGLPEHDQVPGVAALPADDAGPGDRAPARPRERPRPLGRLARHAGPRALLLLPDPHPADPSRGAAHRARAHAVRRLVAVPGPPDEPGPGTGRLPLEPVAALRGDGAGGRDRVRGLRLVRTGEGAAEGPVAGVPVSESPTRASSRCPP